MITNMDKLRGKIAERGLTNEALADALNVDKSTFYRKIKLNGLSFSIREVHQIVDALSLSVDEAKDIFLSQNLH